MFSLIPDFVNIDYNSFGKRNIENLISDEFENGIVQRKPRFSKTRQQISFSIWFKTSKEPDFESWFDNTLLYGSKPFYIVFGPNRKEVLIRLTRNDLEFTYRDEHTVISLEAEFYG